MTATSPVQTSTTERSWRPLRAPLVVCGVGFGGFFDGIVFHQILQLHHMLSNAGNDRIGLNIEPVTTIAGLELNTLWDGLFHAATYLALLGGVVWLWARWHRGEPVQPPWRLLADGLLTGWGLFNLVEGVINHHVLAIHHVVDGDNPLVFDLAFLAVGLAMAVVGVRLTKHQPDRDHT